MEKETAIQKGELCYQIITDICSVCGRRAPWRYVHNDKCQSCCAQQAGDLYDIAVNASLLNQSNMTIEYRPDRMGRTRPARSITQEEYNHIIECLKLAGEDDNNLAVISKEQAMLRGLNNYLRPEYCRICGNVGLRTITERCYFCKIEKKAIKRQDNSPRQQAIANGQPWYTPLDPCPRCGKTAPRRVNNGQCSGCIPVTVIRQPDSPRQQAIANGQPWYTPVDPCPRCGKTVPRRVNNGQCSGCSNPTARQPATTARQWIIDHPNMILDRAMARILGVKVYRTGRTCCHDNQGWKWTSTGNCVDCKPDVK